MPRDIPVGNGSLLVAFDDGYQIRDLFFPYVGKENHSEGHPFRFGVWVNDAFSWISEPGWTRDLRYKPETLVTDVRLTNAALGVEITANDAVDSNENIYLRQLRVRNLSDTPSEVRLFFHQDFYISETEVGDTAYFDPDTRAIIHYKGRRYFLISTDVPEGMDTFATGRKAFRGHEGTWRDAEDGVLAEGAITEGSVDSTIGRKLFIDAGASAEMFYWIAVGTSYQEVATLNALARERHPRALIERTHNYWHAWVNKNDTNFADLSPEITDLFKRSLLIIRTQIDNGGAIIAANDSDVTLRATDHYSYLWPRDGALVAHALDLAGYSHLSRSFFDLCGRIISAEGYFLQKYNPDGSVASGWHASWDARTKTPLVPIQEDETALVLWALWHHYDKFRDIEFAKKLYRPLITHAADFLLSFRDEETKLPQPSWNLWEDRRGIHTFTCAAVVGGLRGAAHFATLFGETKRALAYEQAAMEVRDAMRAYLYRTELRRFARALMPQANGSYEVDAIVDASLFGIFYFGAFAPDDPIVVETMRAVEEILSAQTDVGGIARYEADGYMRTSASSSHNSDDAAADESRSMASNMVHGNPWFICTLWLADYRIARARSLEELRGAAQILEWVIKRALPSGVLAEQVNPHTGAPVSVSPLTWSHSTFVATVMSYLRKREALLASV